MASVVWLSANSGKPLRNWPSHTAGRIRGPRIKVAATAMPEGGKIGLTSAGPIPNHTMTSPATL